MTPCIHTYKREKSLLKHIAASKDHLQWRSAKYSRNLGGNTFHYRLSRKIFAFCRGANYPYGRSADLQPKCSELGELL